MKKIIWILLLAVSCNPVFAQFFGGVSQSQVQIEDNNLSYNLNQNYTDSLMFYISSGSRDYYIDTITAENITLQSNIQKLSNSNRWTTNLGSWTTSGNMSATRQSDSSVTLNNIPTELNPNPYFANWSYTELITNGDMSSSTGWALNTAVISSGVLSVTGAYGYGQQNILTSNHTYRFRFDMNNYTSGNSGLSSQTVSGGYFPNANGSFDVIKVANGASTNFRLFSESVDVTFDNASVKELIAPTGWETSAMDANNYVIQDVNGMKLVSNGTIVYVTKSSICTIGKTYKYKIVISSLTGSGLQFDANDAVPSAVYFATAGTYEGTFVADNTGFTIKRTGATEAVVSYFSLTEVKGESEFKLSQNTDVNKKYRLSVDYKDANTDKVSGWNFTNWGTNSGATINDYNTFTTTTTTSIFKNFSLTEYTPYYVRLKGNTTSSSLQLADGYTQNKSITLSGSFDTLFYYYRGDSYSSFGVYALLYQTAGTTNIDEFRLYKLDSENQTAESSKLILQYGGYKDSSNTVSNTSQNFTTEFWGQGANDLKLSLSGESKANIKNISLEEITTKKVVKKGFTTKVYFTPNTSTVGSKSATITLNGNKVVNINYNVATNKVLLADDYDWGYIDQPISLNGNITLTNDSGEPININSVSGLKYPFSIIDYPNVINAQSTDYGLVNIMASVNGTYLDTLIIDHNGDDDKDSVILSAEVNISPTENQLLKPVSFIATSNGTSGNNLSWTDNNVDDIITSVNNNFSSSSQLSEWTVWNSSSALNSGKIKITNNSISSEWFGVYRSHLIGTGKYAKITVDAKIGSAGSAWLVIQDPITYAYYYNHEVTSDQTITYTITSATSDYVKVYLQGNGVNPEYVEFDNYKLETKEKSFDHIEVWHQNYLSGTPSSDWSLLTSIASNSATTFTHEPLIDDSEHNYKVRLLKGALYSDFSNSDTALYNYTGSSGSLAITTQPTSQTKNVGETATFTVAFTGATNKGYQWWKNGSTAISGATSATLTISNVQSSDAGTYLCEVKNLDCYPSSSCWLNSNEVSLTVNSSGGGTYEYDYIVGTGGDFSTIAQLNAASIPSGSVVGFQGGQVFSDATLNCKAGVTYTTYGSGIATIGNASSTVNPTVLINYENIILDNLKLYGSSITTNNRIVTVNDDAFTLKNCELIGGNGFPQSFSNKGIFQQSTGLTKASTIYNNIFHNIPECIYWENPYNLDISYNEFYDLYFYYGKAADGGGAIGLYESNADATYGHDANYTVNIHHNKIHKFEYAAFTHMVSKVIIEYNEIAYNLDERVFMGGVAHGVVGKVYQNDQHIYGGVGLIFRYNYVHDLNRRGEANKSYSRPTQSAMQNALNDFSGDYSNQTGTNSYGRPLYVGAGVGGSWYGSDYGDISEENVGNTLGGAGYGNLYIHNNIFKNISPKILSRGANQNSSSLTFSNSYQSHFYNNTVVDAGKATWITDGYGLITIDGNAQSPTLIKNNTIDFSNAHSSAPAIFSDENEGTNETSYNIFTNRSGITYSTVSNHAIYSRSANMTTVNNQYNANPNYNNTSGTITLSNVGISGVTITDYRTLSGNAYNTGVSLGSDPTGRSYNYSINGTLRSTNNIGAL